MSMKSYAKVISLLAPALAMGGYLPDLPGFKTSEAERKIDRMRIDTLLEQYKLIQQKKCSLPRREREIIEGRVQYLIAKGHINEDLTIVITL